MQNLVQSKFINVSPAERTQLKNTVNQYVRSNEFCRMIQNINVDDARNDPASRCIFGNIYFICSQLNIFNGFPDRLAEATAWLNSV